MSLQKLLFLTALSTSPIQAIAQETVEPRQVTVLGTCEALAYLAGVSEFHLVDPDDPQGILERLSLDFDRRKVSGASYVTMATLDEETGGMMPIEGHFSNLEVFTGPDYVQVTDTHNNGSSPGYLIFSDLLADRTVVVQMYENPIQANPLFRAADFGGNIRDMYRRQCGPNSELRETLSGGFS